MEPARVAVGAVSVSAARRELDEGSLMCGALPSPWATVVERVGGCADRSRGYGSSAESRSTAGRPPSAGFIRSASRIDLIGPSTARPNSYALYSLSDHRGYISTLATVDPIGYPGAFRPPPAEMGDPSDGHHPGLNAHRIRPRIKSML